MTTLTKEPPGSSAPASTRDVLHQHGVLPPWAPPVVAAAALVVGLGAGLLVANSLAAGAVLTALLYVVAIYLVARAVEGPRKATDRAVTGVVTSAFLVALAPLVSVAWTVVRLGAERFDVQFFTYSMRGVVGEGGGAYHAIVGTLVVTALATAISVPVGLFTSIYLIEYGRGRLARAITFFVDVMTGIPSIVAGLFAYALFELFLGPGTRSGISGAVALSVLMIPVVVRSCEEMLKLVPNELREAAYALGVPKWRTIVKVVIPTALAGIATGVTLAIARVIGETAPLLITMGTTTSLNVNPFVEGRMATLPVFAYYQYATPGVDTASYTERMWAAALTLILIVMLLNVIARVVSRVFSPQTGR
jgi:phosphate transport system permease protein